MTQYKKILIAFDGSENGLKALEDAKKLTIDNNALLTVLYVHDSPLERSISISMTTAEDSYLSMDPGALLGNAPNLAAEETILVEKDIPNQVMAIAKAKLTGFEKVNYKKIVGKAAEEIVTYATSNDMDLIVIGNRGIGVLEKFVLGSVSNKVTNHSECSVFIVK